MSHGSSCSTVLMWWRWSMINYWTRLDQASKPTLPPSLPLPPPHTVKLSSYRTPLVLVGNKKDLHMQRYHWLYTVVSIHPTPPPSSSCVEWWRTRWGRSWLQSGMPLLWSPQLNRTRYVHDVALTPGDVKLWYNSSWVMSQYILDCTHERWCSLMMYVRFEPIT